MMLEDLYRLLRSSHVQAQGVIDMISVPLLVLDDAFRVLTANNAFIKTFGVSRDDVIERSLFSLGNGQWNIPELKILFEAVIPRSAGILGYEVAHDFPAIGNRSFLVDARRLVHPDDNSVNILVQFEDVTDKNRQDAERDFVVAETRHRMRNIFSIVRSIALQTETQDRTAEEYRRTLLGRIETAMTAQELSLTSTSTDFADLIERTVSFAGLERFRISAGPVAGLSGAKVMSVGMMLHELTTNALKHGALSQSKGAVRVSWTIEAKDNGKKELICEWREEDGPPCQEPTTRGYGTSLIAGTAKHMGGQATLTFASDGLFAVLKIPL